MNAACFKRRYYSYKKGGRAYHGYRNINKITLYADSQAAIKALSSNEAYSKLVVDCRNKLKPSTAIKSAAGFHDTKDTKETKSQMNFLNKDHK